MAPIIFKYAAYCSLRDFYVKMEDVAEDCTERRTISGHDAYNRSCGQPQSPHSRHGATDRRCVGGQLARWQAVFM